MANNVNYKKIAFYQGRAANTSTGFCTFSENGLYYFTCNKNDEIYLFSTGFTSAAARNRNLHKLSENLLFAKSYERIQESKNRFYFLIKTDTQEELARSKFFATEDAMNVFIGWVMGSKFVIDYSQNTNEQTTNINTTVLKGNYNKYINYTIYKGSNQKLYFAYADKDDNTYLLNPVISGFDNEEDVKKMVETVNEVARRPKAYKVNLAKSGKYFFYLKNNTETLAKSIFFNNEKEMLKVIEKLVNHKNSDRTVISSKLKEAATENNNVAKDDDDFEAVLKAQQKAELEVRLKKRNEEVQKKQEQADLSLEQVFQNQLNVKDLANKGRQENNLENGKLNGAGIELPLDSENELSAENLLPNETSTIGDNGNLNNKKLKVKTIDANKISQPKIAKPEKRLKVRTVDANKELREKTVDANKPAETKTIKPEKKLKVRTVDANKEIKAKTVDPNEQIENKIEAPKKKLKVRTVNANKPTIEKKVGTDKATESKTQKLDKKLRVRTVDANKPAIEKKKVTTIKPGIVDNVDENANENSVADIAYEKRLAQDKLEALKKKAGKNINNKEVLKKPKNQNSFPLSKIIKPAIILLLVFVVVGLGILAFLSRDKGYNTVRPVATAEIVKKEPDKSNLTQFKPGKVAPSASAISNFKSGTVEQLLKNCIEDAYCAVPSNFHWVEANFEDGLSVLPLDAKTSLSRIIELMKAYPEMKLAIAGHTAYGETDKNIASLSEVRSKTVYDYFVKNGITAERLNQAGMADKQPISFGNSLTAKHQNKRIDFTLIQK